MINIPGNKVPYQGLYKGPPCADRVRLITQIDGNEVHEYFISDSRGVIDNSYNVSASGLLAMYKKWNALKPYEHDPRTLYLRAINESKRNGTLPPYRFKDTAQNLSETLGLYADYVYESGIETPLTYEERRLLILRLQTKERPNDFAAFHRSCVFKSFENWAIGKHPIEFAFDSVSIEEVNYFLRHVSQDTNNETHRFVHIKSKDVRACFNYWFSKCPNKNAVNGEEIAAFYRLPCEAGTLLHAYLEARVKNYNDVPIEEIRNKYPCREDEDYEIADDFLSSLFEGEFPIYTELAVASLEHLICGCIDIVRIWPICNSFELIDYKRSLFFENQTWWVNRQYEPCRTKLGFGNKLIVYPNLSLIAISNTLIKYAIQMAIYYFLLIFSGCKQVSSIAYLICMHPHINTYEIIGIDLNMLLRPDTRNTLQMGYGAVLTPLQIANNLFQFAARELRKFLPLLKE